MLTHFVKMLGAINDPLCIRFHFVLARSPLTQTKANESHLLCWGAALLMWIRWLKFNVSVRDDSLFTVCSYDKVSTCLKRGMYFPPPPAHQETLLLKCSSSSYTLLLSIPLWQYDQAGRSPGLKNNYDFWIFATSWMGHALNGKSYIYFEFIIEFLPRVLLENS